MFARYGTTVISPIKTKTPSKKPWTSGHSLWLTWNRDRPKQDTVGPIRAIRHHIHAVVNAITHIHIKTPWRTKKGFIAWSPSSKTMTGRVVLGIRLRFNNHAPKQTSIVLTFHQTATDEVWGD
jgi:hypothetical protein